MASLRETVPETEASQVLVDRSALNELIAEIGSDKLLRILDRFILSLATAFDGADRAPADYGREAHTLVSMAGMLGCGALSIACRDLEQSALVGRDLTGSLAEIRTLRDRTRAALQIVLAEIGAVR